MKQIFASAEISPLYYSYILSCHDGTYYTGYTTDLCARLKRHNAGKGAKYTRTRRPVIFAYVQCHLSRSEAMSAEWHIKQLSRKQKTALIASRPFCLCHQGCLFDCSEN